MPDKNIYEQCPLCHSHRIDRDACRACDGEGYIATGVYVGQFERAMEDAKRLQHMEVLALSLTPCFETSVGHYWRGISAHNLTREFCGENPRAVIDAAIKGLMQ